MRAVYIFIPVFFAIFTRATLSSAEGGDAYLSKLKDGMSVSDVVGILGEPQGRLEMETKRETRLVYPKQSLKFVEGRLALDFGRGATTEISHVSAPDNKSSGDSPNKNTSSSLKSAARSLASPGAEAVRPEAVRPLAVGTGAARPAAPDSAVKLETVLSEVMHTKATSPASSPDNARFPSGQALPPGIPPPGISGNGAFGSGMQPPPMMPGSPYGSMPGGLYQQGRPHLDSRLDSQLEPEQDDSSDADE